MPERAVHLSAEIGQRSSIELGNEVGQEHGNRPANANDPTHLRCSPAGPMIGSAMFEDIGAEFRGASLGDERRSARLERIGATLSRDPASSFPEAMGSEGQLKALYRFLVTVRPWPAMGVVTS